MGIFRILALFLIIVFVPKTQSGSLASSSSTPKTTTLTVTTRSFGSYFETLSSSITSGVHSIGGVIPLRGLASICADLGIPGAVTLTNFLTPTGRNANTTVIKNVFKDAGLSAILAALGDKSCLLRLVCLAGKTLSSSVSGTSAVTLILSSILHRLPWSPMGEITNVLKNSIFYSDDCARYVCEQEHVTSTFLYDKLYVQMFSSHNSV